MSEQITPDSQAIGHPEISLGLEKYRTPISIISLADQFRDAEDFPAQLQAEIARADYIWHLDGHEGSSGESEFTIGKDDIVHVHTLADRYLAEVDESTRGAYSSFIDPTETSQPGLEDLLILTANIVRRASGEHNDLVGWDDATFMRPLREVLDFDRRPDTVCRVYNGAFRAVFEILAARFNPDITERYHLINTSAEVSADLPDLRRDFNLLSLQPKQPHRYLTLVSYDESQGIRATPVDPYHMGQGELSNDEQGLSRLDFSSYRAVDSFGVTWLAARGERYPGKLSPDERMVFLADLMQAFPAGLDSLSAALLVAHDANDILDKADKGPIVGYSLTGLRARVASLARRPSLVVLMESGRSKSFLEREPSDYRRATEDEIDEYVAKHAPELAQAQNELAIAETQYSKLTEYVNNAVIGTLRLGVEMSPLELVALVRLLDITAACNIDLSANVWRAAKDTMVELAGSDQFLATALGKSGFEAGGARWRAVDDLLYLPEYEDEAAYNAWRDCKVEYYVLLARADVTGWAGKLPRAAIFEYLKTRSDHQWNVRPNLPRAERYGTFLNNLAARLEQEGFGDLVAKVRSKL